MAAVALGVGTEARAAAPSPCFGIGVRRRDGPFELADLRPELPEDAIAPHAHDEGHFVLVLEGGYVSSAAGAPLLSTGPLLIYNPPGTVHRDRCRGDGRFVAIGLPADAVAGLPELPVRMTGPAMGAALRAARLNAGGGADLAGSCWELVAAAGHRARVGHRPRWLTDARAMIDEGTGRPLRLGEVAAEAGVHPVHLARVFRAAFGCAPSDYQAFARLRRARGLLAGTRLPLAEIALRTGFADQSHLTRAFSRRVGIAPGAFRAALGNVAIGQDAGAADGQERSRP